MSRRKKPNRRVKGRARQDARQGKRVRWTAAVLGAVALAIAVLAAAAGCHQTIYNDGLSGALIQARKCLTFLTRDTGNHINIG